MHKKQIYSGKITNKSNFFKYGNYALFARDTGLITVEQISALRVAIQRKIRGVGKLFIHIIPNKQITRKSCGIRMGKGKGSFYKSVYFVRKGEIILELQLGSFKEFAKKLLLMGSSKLSVKTYIRFK